MKNEPLYFKIAGHDICLLPPSFGSITIAVPWPKDHHPSNNQKAFVVNTAQNVLTYMVTEGIIPPKSGMNIQILTDHTN